MDAPKVSVLVPVYNTPEKYLREAIGSILKQTFTDFELIVVNDASTDDAVEKTIRDFADPRIRYFANPVNLGISGTRNRLIDLARGEYLAVMDHDDISLPERFQKEVEFLDANPDVGVVSSAAKMIFDDKTEVLRYPEADADIRLNFFEGCALIHSASMIRKSVLDAHDIRYEPEYSPAEDYALWCRLIPYTRFHNLPEILFHYRFHATNTSGLNKDKMERARIAVLNKLTAENPALFNTYRELVVYTTNIKLFGFIPFLKIVRRGRKTTCNMFGLRLCSIRWGSKLFS